MRRAILIACLATSLGACAVEQRLDGPGGSGASGGKADSFDANQWQEATDCGGWNLCLASLVAAKTNRDYDAGYRYPMRAAMGSLLSVDVDVSDNCKDNIAFDESNNIVCVPNGDSSAAFIFGHVERESTSEEGYAYIVYAYDSSRARLYKHPETESYYLMVAETLPSNTDWQLVEHCGGSDVCLDEVLASLASAGDGYDYPVLEDSDADITISANCEGNVAVDDDSFLVCAPDGSSNQAFVFGQANEEWANDGTTYVDFAYVGVRLFADPEAPGRYYLEISAPERSPVDSWEEVVECAGWSLCIDNLVAAETSRDYDASYSYPMRRTLDLVDSVDVEISGNCRDNIALDADRNVVCVPNGNTDEAFIFGHATRESTSEAGYGYVEYAYDSARARLYKDPNSSRHFLDLRP